MNIKKATNTAKEWLYPALMAAVFDCSDSTHDAERLENRFNALVDDSISIEKFVKDNLYTEYISECKNVVKESGCELHERLEQFQDTPSSLPIPYEEIENDLKNLFATL